MTSKGGGGEGGEKPSSEEQQQQEQPEQQPPTEPLPPGETLLKDLLILPPKRRGDSDDKQREIDALQRLRLPLLRADEPVQSIKGALSEVIAYAHWTQYRLELEDPPAEVAATEKAKKKSESHRATPENVISPYTGKDATIMVPAQARGVPPAAPSSKVLDDYGDLTPLLRSGLRDGSAFRIVLERYSGSGCTDHVIRLQQLLDGNAPTVTTMFEPREEDELEEGGEQRGGGVEGEQEEEEEEEGIAAGKPFDEAPKEASPPETAERQKLPETLPPSDASMIALMDGTNLQDFFYLVWGEDPREYRGEGVLSAKPSESPVAVASPGRSKRKKRIKPAAHRDDSAAAATDEEDESKHKEENSVGWFRNSMVRWNELEELTRVACIIKLSPFHPPSRQRRWMGDLAYYTVTLPAEGKDEETVLNVTATTLGFYINRTASAVFDPSPAVEPCFSHALLDCLLAASPIFGERWITALNASKERAELVDLMNEKYPTLALFRLATRSDFDGFKTAASAFNATCQTLDASLIAPTWLVPLPRKALEQSSAKDDGVSIWTHNSLHLYNPHRADEELRNTYGVDIHNGCVRDWNEELQLAREHPTTTLHERIERARMIHKVMTEFGEAALLGVKAICEGQLTPMNPNEAVRAQLFLHNNIFFSRGADAGPETFKIAKGHRAARKSANRDLQCIGTFHRMDKSGISTLATVLIDYLGVRFVCQSILPGILVGEKSHTLLYGAVEQGVPLQWNEELHKLFEEKIGEGMMIATRPVFRNPLTKERMEEIQALRKATMPLYPAAAPVTGLEKKTEEEQPDPDAVVNTCVPIEAKGILGSDQRKYVLDFGRLTPRDANWVPKEKGGTGKFEACLEGAKSSTVPASLEDEEWTMSVLRPELVSRFTQFTMAKYIQAKRQKDEQPSPENGGKEASSNGEKEKAPVASETDSISSDKRGTNGSDHEKTDGNSEKTESEKEKDGPGSESYKFTEDDLEYMKGLKLNVNVFLPFVRSFEGINQEAAALIKQDEERARQAATFLWDDVLPKITRAIKDGSVQQIPLDGKALTEFLHRNGVNCRYLGRLAILAKEVEDRDARTNAELKQGRAIIIERRTMPKCWLELLECEMVARAAKHVLDSYLTENGAVAATQPAQTIASFLSALVSEGEETAAQTETRMEKGPALEPDDDDIGALTITNVGGGGDALLSPIRSRYEVWHDIEAEIGRRFRYKLTLYNNGNRSGRALYIPLLRRVCQRTGVRLFAKKYDVGGKCLCSGGNTFCGRLIASYPISPLDIVDIVPLMKHCAAYSEGFAPCALGPSISLPPLQVSLQDARATLQRAHIQAGSRALGHGLALAQEAAALYQKVTESAAHPGVIECVDLMATILLEAGDPASAAANGIKALGLTVQSSGFDSANVFICHMTLFEMLSAAGDLETCIKNLRAAIFLLEVMGGHNHLEHFTAYHKLAGVYSHSEYGGKYLQFALELFTEASKRDSPDRLMEGITAKNFAQVLAGLENYKGAMEYEKKALRTLTMFCGKEHHFTRESEADFRNYVKLAVEKGSRRQQNERMLEQTAKAEAVAADLAAEEESKKKKHSRMKKKKHKK